jgi:mono/diheme cytochrome c family protein
MNPRPAILSLGAMLLLSGPMLAACGGSGPAVAQATTPAGGPRGAAELFAAACASCHGRLGDGGPSGVPLAEVTADRVSIIGVIRYGVGGMPASSNGMSDAEVEALADYVAGLGQELDGPACSPCSSQGPNPMEVTK